jgi:hypothetical protein
LLFPLTAQCFLPDGIFAQDWSILVTVTSIVMTMTVNAVVTGLIVFKIFKVFTKVKPTSDEKTLGATRHGSKLLPIMFVIIESGMILRIGFLDPVNILFLSAFSSGQSVRHRKQTSVSLQRSSTTSRWRHFELSASSEAAAFFRPEGSHAPILESFRLEFPRRRNTGFHRLVTCPRLQKVHLASVRLMGIRFPWKNVTHLCAQAMTFEDCLKILQNTPFLVHAEFLNTQEPRLYTSGSIIIASLSPTYNMYISMLTTFPFLARSGPLHNFSMFDFVPRNSRLMTSNAFSPEFGLIPID